MSSEQQSQKILSVIVLASIISLLIANLFITNVLATTGEGLNSLQTRKNNLLEQNSRLNQEVIANSSFKTIEEKALSMGFFKTKETVSLVSEPPIAMNQQ